MLASWNSDKGINGTWGIQGNATKEMVIEQGFEKK
jgi:hypothetical protein